MIPTGSAHYKGGNIEPLELIESQGLGFHLGCVVKYVVRAHYYATAGPFGPTEQVLDAVNKAIWYLERWKELIQCRDSLPSSAEASTQPSPSQKSSQGTTRSPRR